MLRRVPYQHQVGALLRGRPIAAQPGKIVIDPDIAIHHQERLPAQHGKGELDTSRRLQRFILARIPDIDTPALAVTAVVDDLLGQVRDIDHQFPESGLREACDMVFDQWFAPYLQQWLGRMIGQRAHALAHACRENHHSQCAALQGWPTILGVSALSNHAENSAKAASREAYAARTSRT